VLKVSAEAHPVVIIRTSEHHVLSRPRLSVRMFGSWGKKRANASSNCASAAIFVPFRIWMGEKLLHHLLRCDFRAVTSPAGLQADIPQGESALTFSMVASSRALIRRRFP